MQTLTLLIHAAATLFLTGVIWFVQVVHYPLLAESCPSGAGGGHWRHVRRTTSLVVPVMALEGGAAVLLAWHSPEGWARGLAIVGLLLAGVNWLSTASVQVPAHRLLLRQWNAEIARGLVRSNWLRTVAWSTRSVLALCLLAETRPLGGR